MVTFDLLTPEQPHKMPDLGGHLLPVTPQEVEMVGF